MDQDQEEKTLNNQTELSEENDIEKKIIVSLFNSPKFVSDTVTRLSSQDFKNPIYRAIFLEIVELYNANEKVITPGLVKERINTINYDANPLDFEFIFQELGFSVPCTNQDEFKKLVDIKKCQSIQKALNEFGANDLSNIKLTTKNIESTLEVINSTFFSITSSWVTNAEGKEAKTLSLEFEKEINNKQNNNSSLEDRFNSFKYNWCLRSIYEIIDKFENKSLYILAARPGMGKTTLALNWAVALSKMAYEKNAEISNNDKKHKVLFFSLEMSANQMFDKVVSLLSYIDSYKLKKKTLDGKDLAKYSYACQNEHLNELPLVFFDDGSLTLSKIESIVKEYSAKYIIDLVVIDYLQLIKLGDEYFRSSFNRTNEVAVISKTLKTMALNLSVPILSLSQLSRRVEANGENKKPLLSDLKESGSIEQDADVVMFLYVDDETKNIVVGEPNKETYGINLAVEKNRFGATGSKQLAFSKYCSRFQDMIYIQNPNVKKY